MNFEGKSIQCSLLDGGIAELRIDLKEDPVNKLNKATLEELGEAVARIRSERGVRGLLLSSGKDVFIVGADVTEFPAYFRNSEEQLTQWLLGVDRLFAAIEDFDFPTVAALNGYAFGGGLELALATSWRVMADNTRIGVPETKLGLFPGWGGTVRLSRLVGADNAIEWIASGEQYGADAALKTGVVDAVVAPELVREAALDLLTQAVAGRRDWRARRLEKVSPLKLNQVEAAMVFEGAKAFVGAKAGPHYPAPLAAIEAMQKGAGLGRDEALAIEAAAFARMARTPAAFNLVSIFLGEREVARKARKAAKAGSPVNAAAVLGAGIMGGGIAFQSALKGIPIVMKDIAEKALEAGLAEADRLLVKRVEKGRLDPAGMAQVLNRIRPAMGYGEFQGVDLVVEAVVEDERVKRKVLAEVEAQVREDAVLASNTSTISITRLGEALKRPGNLCGMHFFNPVPKMLLVEVIRGRDSSERAVAATVGYALALGKTPIVVNDCPGFFVNRVLFPYFAGFLRLVEDGVDYQKIDQVMERFGWPMGPAWLLDVVGIDTARHAGAVMAQGYPDRMAHDRPTAIEAMFERGRFGQKNGKGFYRYLEDRKGVPKKEPDPEAQEILKALVRGGGAQVSDQDIVDRMMLPMIIECSRCLEDGIVATPGEVDLGLVYGLGFPPFRGGALRHADAVGLAEVCRAAERHRSLGRLYEPTAQMLRLAQAGSAFHATNEEK
ncbi:MAG: fatty acid oxidation complex subunit alpha FadB [Holophaga sp.]|jgi:3-hydroxyacyl-CoA dehydrogenase/enoyl-CoA hydratase/3-hydroxybutyryl-CoA epimerase/enoyl-CoA isomerase